MNIILDRFLAASETLDRTREAVGGRHVGFTHPVESDSPETRLLNGALAIAQAELEDAKHKLLEFILKEGLPALEVKEDPNVKLSGGSREHWLQEQANHLKRQVFMRWGDGLLGKRPTNTQGL